ncbi:hypothetical protein PV371_38890 [Streptomyces sp. TX20-6-3]|uniref:hypothetical protein n=1 Tax=Streptomyces sp. TX20-6-3 TaxID=3028705 RepID=UPI0029ADBDA7|nr:hypothetical protein [Streptomyces sp. TX20-6-3]MDX2565472.1 hypothetical protein [Streptomyces sp. TX20-6-3]
MPAALPPPHPSPGGMPGLEAAAAAVIAAQRALAQARRDLSAAVHDARGAGEPVRTIAERTGLDAMTIRNILAVPPAAPPGRGS